LRSADSRPGWWRIEPQPKDFVFIPESRRVAITTACIANLNFREEGIDEPPPPQPEEEGQGVPFPVRGKDGKVVIISIMLSGATHFAH
jgi:hypothetical protein